MGYGQIVEVLGWPGVCAGTYIVRVVLFPQDAFEGFEVLDAKF